MGKPEPAPVGTKLKSGKHAKAVENRDFAELKGILGFPPANRKERRQRKSKWQ